MIDTVKTMLLVVLVTIKEFVDFLLAWLFGGPQL